MLTEPPKLFFLKTKDDLRALARSARAGKKRRNAGKNANKNPNKNPSKNASKNAGNSGRTRR
tara:strand:- start:1034 stop:1219 length:186 start_codon:yes stop_codon:yes gene_type:complete